MTTQDHQRAVQARILERARELQRQGFAVQVEPDPQQVPAFLRSFSVDLIAEREGEGLVLEVKAGHELQRPPYLEELARAVEQQPGWRFELELVEPEWADRPPQKPRGLRQIAPRKVGVTGSRVDNSSSARLRR